MAWWLFQNVVITTALAAIVVTICRTTRIGPVARHALWVLVLVKFVTPPLLVWPWPAPDPLGLAALDARGGNHLAGRGIQVAGDDATAAGEADQLVAPAASTLAANSPDASTSRAASTGFSGLIVLWAAGSVGFVVLEGARLVRLARRVKHAVPAEPAIVDRVADLSARLGLRPVPVVMIAGSASPVVWCVGRPRLLWPAALAADSTGACIDGVIVHELAHVKRRDHLVGWIELAAAVVWWWNPLFWYVRSALREQAELACDAWVISALPNGRRAYAESLLALCGATLPGTPLRSMAALIGIRPGSRRALERRLVMIMKGRAPLHLPLAGLLALALMAAATLPAWATGSPQQPPPPPPSPPVVKPAPAQQAGPPPPPPAAVVKPAPASQVGPPSPPKPPARLDRKVAVPSRKLSIEFARPNLPPDGRQLVEVFETDRRAIQEEADRKLDERRAALVKSLEALQEQYTKAGKLDEAVAVRDYLRTAGWGRDRLLFSNDPAWTVRRR